MNKAFASAIDGARKIAEQRNIPWLLELQPDGRILDRDVWNLNALVSAVTPQVHYFNNLGPDVKSLRALNTMRGVHTSPSPLDAHWQDLIKAAVLDQLFVRRNGVGHIATHVIRPLKIIAMSAGALPPWQLSVDHVLLALEVADQVQSSGKLKDVVIGIVKTVIDGWHISECGPLYSQLGVTRLKNTKRARFARREKDVLTSLDERKRAERLPERKAFWELVRIVFCEKPQSFTDEIRFAVIKILLICGLRIGEVVFLPEDWRATRNHVDRHGKPAGESGGLSTSIMLKHFAEKQQSERFDSEVLYPATQHIPTIFEEVLTSTLERVAELTAPLRATLRKQVESGRLLPWFDQDDLVPLVRLYPYITGQPFWLKMPDETQRKFIRQYVNSFAASVLNELSDFQHNQYWDGSGTLDGSAYTQLHRLKNDIESGKTNLKLYSAEGVPYDGSNIKKTPWKNICVRISELEKHLTERASTKLPDVRPLRLGNGEYVQSWELMFLLPKRALSEDRNEGICDVTRHYAVGTLDAETVRLALSSSNPDSLFARYGNSAEDRMLFLNPHSLRHLQNSELFRMGIADAVISKRYNRKSVTQSYEYDHRSLAEQLDEMELPEEVELALGTKSSTVLKMIQSGKASGPIVENFRKIQAAKGDSEAFEYLRTEADGFHATPYGHCLNSFTVDPCPKHLECFAGCRHLSATDLPANRRNLVNLEGKLLTTVTTLRGRKASGIGLANQLAHAEVRLDGVRKLLATPPGEQVFPNGRDFSIGPSPTVQDIE